MGLRQFWEEWGREEELRGGQTGFFQIPCCSELSRKGSSTLDRSDSRASHPTSPLWSVLRKLWEDREGAGRDISYLLISGVSRELSPCF